MKKPLRILFAALGFICFAFGAIGAFLPILPTTPFLLLASFFFAKSSKRFNDWFTSTKLYRNHLDSFVKERSMTLKTKIGLCAFASTMLIIAIIMMDNIYGRIFLVCLIAVKYYYFIFRIKTIKKGEDPLSVANKEVIEPAVAETDIHLTLSEIGESNATSKQYLVSEES